MPGGHKNKYGMVEAKKYGNEKETVLRINPVLNLTLANRINIGSRAGNVSDKYFNTPSPSYYAFVTYPTLSTCIQLQRHDRPSLGLIH